ncbi:hypothetical protein Tco_1532368 [Tanacetum coccineum]
MHSYDNISRRLKSASTKFAPDSKVASLEAEKAKLEATKALLHQEVDVVKRDRLRCAAFEEVAGMKEPFDLEKVRGYRPSYKKEHTKADNDLANATFPYLK